MNNEDIKDPIFKKAVEAIDHGDIVELETLLNQNHYLIKDRLDFPGKGYFANPYLLWFVADNPIRHEKLPGNIVDITRVLIDHAKKESPDNLQYQLDYTLGLVDTGRITRESGVQIDLMDLLIDSGAVPGQGKGAIAHGNLDAARHLLKRGAKISLTVAVSLDLREEAERLFAESENDERITAMTAAAFLGKADMISWLLKKGVSPNGYPPQNSGFHSHATPLHQAVFSGSMESVKLLLAAGASLDSRDRVYDGTPLGWAEYMISEESNEENIGRFREIANYLRPMTDDR